MRTLAWRPSQLLLSLFFITTAGCGGDGTGADTPLRITPGAARPYAVVQVEGLPAEYAASAELEITVGGQRSVLVYDAGQKAHHFAVPALAPGRVKVEIPAVRAGEPALSGSLDVQAPEYRGGTPDAAVQEMGLVLDSLQVSAAFAMRALSPTADSALYGRLETSLELAEDLQTAVKSLSPSARATVAAIYTEHAAELDSLTEMIARGAAQLDSLPPTGATVRMPYASAPVAADVLVRRCQARMELIRGMARMEERLKNIALLVNVTLLIVAPEAFPVVALLTAKLLMAFDIAVMMNNLIPDLFEEKGLRLQVNPARIKHDGGTGDMSAVVRRRASGEVLSAGAGIVGGLVAPFEAYQRLTELRELTRLDFVAQGLKAIGKDEFVDHLLELMDHAVAEYVGRAVGGETPVSFNGIQFTQGLSGRWEFTGTAGSFSRGLRTVGQVQGVETVQLAASLGSGEGCVAQTAGATPTVGLNGFEIASSASLKFDAGTTVSVAAGGSATLAVAIRNVGGDTARGITYRLADPATGAWTAPAWLQVQLTAGPATLLPLASDQVRLSVSAGVDAPERSLVVPVAAVLNGRIVTVTTVIVQVEPQLSDVVVNSQQSQIRLWDHGQQDGDLVTVTLNGSPVATGHSLTNAGTVFAVQYRRGRNVLIIHALNEGSLPPNTASLGLSNVVRGVSTQAYELPTGGVVQLSITYDPNAVPVRGSRALPPARLRECTAGSRGDCAAP